MKKTFLSLLLFAALAGAQTTVVGIGPDPSNANNITSGTLNAARLPAAFNPVTISGTTATDAATLGAESIDATGWTSTGWTGSYPFTHTAGNTTALSRAITGMATGTYWQVVLTIASQTAGSIGATLGGASVTDAGTVFGPSGSYTRSAIATGTGGLVVTPTTDFDGTVSVSVKQVTPVSTFAMRANDSTGAASTTLQQQLASYKNTFLGGGVYNTTGFNNVNLGVTTLTGTSAHDTVYLGAGAGSYNPARANAVALGSAAIVMQDNSGVLGTNGMKWSVGGSTKPAGTLEVRDATPATGATTLAVTAGAGQSTTPLLNVTDSGGTHSWLQVLNAVSVPKVGINMIPVKSLDVKGNAVQVSNVTSGNSMAIMGERGSGVDGGFIALSSAGALKVGLDSNGVSYFNGGNLAVGAATDNGVDKLQVTGSAIVTTTINALQGFKYNGTAGYTGTKTAGSCVFTIQGGIITNVTGC